MAILSPLRLKLKEILGLLNSTVHKMGFDQKLIRASIEADIPLGKTSPERLLECMSLTKVVAKQISTVHPGTRSRRAPREIIRLM